MGRWEKPERVLCQRLHGGQHEVDVEELRWRPAVYGIAVERGRVLLGRSAFTGSYDIPGGAVEKGEELRAGLQREFWEETGVLVEPSGLVHIDESFFSFYGRAFQSLRFYFRVEMPGDYSLKAQSPREVVELRWIDVDREAEEEFASGDLSILRKALDNGVSRDLFA